MRRSLMTAPLLLCSLVLLTACAAPPPRVVTEIRIERQEVPAALLTCSPSPAPPAAESQRDVASYIVALWEAGEDCRTKLGEVRVLTAPTP